MTLLSADLSDPLLELLRLQPSLVDALEVGPWFSLQQVEEYRRMLPGYPIYFHGADLLLQVGEDPNAISQAAVYITATGSPWVSMHLSLWSPGALKQMRQGHAPQLLPDIQQASRRLVRQVRQFARSISAPLLLENVEPQPFAGCEFEVQPGLITRLLETTGCGFLLDTGHAFVSASILGMDIHEYCSSLPLDRVAQIHISGPRLCRGRLFDAHEPLRPEDYDLLEFILARSHPGLVTLEYIRQPEALSEQLTLLRQMLQAI